MLTVRVWLVLHPVCLAYWLTEVAVGTSRKNSESRKKPKVLSDYQYESFAWGLLRLSRVPYVYGVPAHAPDDGPVTGA